MMKPVAVLAPMRPNIIGVISAPELVALMPSTPWNTSGVNRIEPNMPNAVRKPTIMLTLNVEFLNRCSGTIGCSTRDSTKTKVASHGEDGREQDAAEDALHAAGHDQLGHVLRQAAQCRRDDEPDHPSEQEGLAAKQVAELAGDGGHGRRGHEVGGGHPRESVQ